MKTYQSPDGRKAYDECPRCGSHSFQNSWHGPAFGLRCTGCGLLGASATSDDNPTLFMPDDQQITFSVVTANQENPH